MGEVVAVVEIDDAPPEANGRRATGRRAGRATSAGRQRGRSRADARRRAGPASAPRFHRSGRSFAQGLVPRVRCDATSPTPARPLGATDDLVERLAAFGHSARSFAGPPAQRSDLGDQVVERRLDGLAELASLPRHVRGCPTSAADPHSAPTARVASRHVRGTRPARSSRLPRLPRARRRLPADGARCRASSSCCTASAGTGPAARPPPACSSWCARASAESPSARRRRASSPAGQVNAVGVGRRLVQGLRQIVRLDRLRLAPRAPRVRSRSRARARCPASGRGQQRRRPPARSSARGRS